MQRDPIKAEAGGIPTGEDSITDVPAVAAIDIPPRGEFQGIFLALKDADPPKTPRRQPKSNGKQPHRFVRVRLGDNTGHFDAYINADVEHWHATLKQDVAVRIRAVRCEDYSQPTVTIVDIELANAEELHPAQFMPATTRDLTPLELEVVVRAREGVADHHYRKLLSFIFDNEEMWEKLRYAPGALRGTHAQLGGLLIRIVGVTRVVDTIGEHYPLNINRSLLLTAGLLHPLGMLQALYIDGHVIKETAAGASDGFITLTRDLIIDVLRENKHAMPEDKLRPLINCVLTQHGERKDVRFLSPLSKLFHLAVCMDEVAASVPVSRVGARPRSKTS